jgi:protocatechuate 3,4-dioxygenase beta subunit
MARGARVREQGSDKTVDARQESQPPYLYPDYVATRLRAPKKPLIILPRSLSDTTAPAFGHGHVGELDNDLTRQHDGEPLGERIIVTGRVLDGEGRPLRNSLIEIWQANEAGRYTDPTEDREKPPHDRDTFSGFGRTGTDADGRFSFVTVKPGPVPDGSLQAPHIMVSVFARGLLKRLVTSIYFPDESEANAKDPVLSSIEDPEYRKTLVAHDEGGVLRFDIHLQGESQTAFFEL